MTSLAAGETSAVVNGGFEAGNTGFTSGYPYEPTGPGCRLPFGGSYTIGADPHTCNGLGASFPAHSGSLMMIVDGATQPGIVVWEQNGVPVMPDTTYHFSAWTAYWDPNSAAPPDVQFSINGMAIGDVITSSVVGLWQEISFPWDSGSSNTADLSIMDLNTAFAGNDFALDDIGLAAATPAPEPASLLLLAMPLAGICLRRPIGRLLSQRRPAASPPCEP
jgi:hypothetical protein